MDVRNKATALAIALLALGGCGENRTVGPTTDDMPKTPLMNP